MVVFKNSKVRSYGGEEQRNFKTISTYMKVYGGIHYNI
jgi:hypothetical protein